LQRGASKTIKETELSRKEGKLKEWNALLSGVEKAIAAELAGRAEREMRVEREKEEARRREAAKAWKRQQEEFMERERANRAAAEARAAKERAAAEALRRAAEERKKKEEEERRKREAKKIEEWRKAVEQRQKEEEERRRVEVKNAEIRRKLLERRQREEEERKKREAREDDELRKNLAEARRNMLSAQKDTLLRQHGQTSTKAGGKTKPAAPSASCQHRGWWKRVEHGSLLCKNCHSSQRRWLLECPSCQMRACAECRKTLQKADWKPHKSQLPRADRRQNAQYEESAGYDAYD
jgi:hypothetical protein